MAWDAFLAALADAPPPRGLVKLQVTGPVTLAAAPERRVADDMGRRGGLAAELATWLAANAAGQVQALRRLGLDALLVVDEPSLAAARPGVEAAWEPLRGVAAARGLHLCCAVPWDVVDAAAPTSSPSTSR